ncbi:MAG: hypothetical protein QOK38_1339 [Acidobacteriaceae bacterium]|nr:hypothetical protein [Acidobacteriaceae bacterium]
MSTKMTGPRSSGVMGKFSLNIKRASHELARVVLAHSGRCVEGAHATSHKACMSLPVGCAAIVWTAPADETTMPQLCGFVRFFIIGVVMVVAVRDLCQDVRLFILVLVGRGRRRRDAGGRCYRCRRR